MSQTLLVDVVRRLLSLHIPAGLAPTQALKRRMANFHGSRRTLRTTGGRGDNTPSILHRAICAGTLPQAAPALE